MSDGNQGYQSLALETVLSHRLLQSSPTLLGRQNLLPAKDGNSSAKLVCHCEGPGCLGVVLAGTGHSLNKLNERTEIHPYLILSEPAPLTLPLSLGLLPSHHWAESSLCPFGVHGNFRSSSGSTGLQNTFWVILPVLILVSQGLWPLVAAQRCRLALCLRFLVAGEI